MNATSAMYDAAVGDFTRGEIDWERDTFKVMLVTGDYQPSQSLDATRADLRRAWKSRPPGTYVRGGKTLPGRSVVRSDIGGDHKLTAGTVAWENVSAKFRYAVVYQANGEAARRPPHLVCGLRTRTGRRQHEHVRHVHGRRARMDQRLMHHLRPGLSLRGTSPVAAVLPRVRVLTRSGGMAARWWHDLDRPGARHPANHGHPRRRTQRHGQSMDEHSRPCRRAASSSSRWRHDRPRGNRGRRNRRHPHRPQVRRRDEDPRHRLRVIARRGRREVRGHRELAGVAVARTPFGGEGE